MQPIGCWKVVAAHSMAVRIGGAAKPPSIGNPGRWKKQTVGVTVRIDYQLWNLGLSFDHPFQDRPAAKMAKLSPPPCGKASASQDDAHTPSARAAHFWKRPGLHERAVMIGLLDDAAAMRQGSSLTRALDTCEMHSGCPLQAMASRGRLGRRLK
jgi:hypothetical protein